MIKYLNVAGINIKFEYNYNDFFKDKIDAYVVDEFNDDFFEIKVSLKDNIEVPEKKITLRYKNRLKMQDGLENYIVTMKPEGVKHLIYYTSDFKNIEIILNTNNKEKLAELEYVFSGMMFFEVAINSNCLPVHASAINYDDQTFLLLGPSKSGKSTHTDNFLRLFPSSIIINEDKPVLFEKNNTIYVAGSPWSGKNVINENISLPVDFLFFLNQEKSINMKELDDKSKILSLLKNCHRPGEVDSITNTTNILNRVIEKLDIYQFDNIDSIESVKFLYNFMTNR